MRNPLILTTSAFALILASAADVYANPECTFCEDSSSTATSTATANANGGNANGGEAGSEDVNGWNDNSYDVYAGGTGTAGNGGIATAIAESFNQSTDVISYQEMNTTVSGSVYVYGGAAYGGNGGNADVYITSDNDANGGHASATAVGGVGGNANANGNGGDADADGNGGTADASGNGGNANGGNADAVATAEAGDASAASSTGVGDTEGGDGGDAYAEGGRLTTGAVGVSVGANGPVGGITNLQTFTGVISGGNAGVSIAANIGSVSIGQ